MFDLNTLCTEKLLKLANFPIESSPREIGKLSYEQILSVKPAALLEAFVRVKKQEEGWKKWKPPAKGTVKKVTDGCVCSKTKENFLIQQVKDVAETQPNVLLFLQLFLKLPYPWQLYYLSHLWYPLEQVVLWIISSLLVIKNGV